MSSFPTYTNENSVIFTITRMNPPMPGHLGLVKLLILEAIQKKVNHVYVCLSKTHDKNNPILCDMKKKLLGDADVVVGGMTMINSLKKIMSDDPVNSRIKAEIEQIKVHLICVAEDESSPFIPIQKVVANKINAQDEPINLFLVVGDDRADMLDRINSNFSSWEHVNKPARGKLVIRKGMKNYIEQTETQAGIDALNVAEITRDEGWSGTMIRNIVRLGGAGLSNKSKFQEIYEGYLEPDVAGDLYDAIWTGINKTYVKKEKLGVKRKTVSASKRSSNSALKKPRASRKKRQNGSTNSSKSRN